MTDDPEAKDVESLELFLERARNAMAVSCSKPILVMLPVGFRKSSSCPVPMWISKLLSSYPRSEKES